jgi:hypothetical protein
MCSQHSNTSPHKAQQTVPLFESHLTSPQLTSLTHTTPHLTTPHLTPRTTPHLIHELFHPPQPWRSFKPDGVILFSDILTPLPGIGVSFEIDDNKGPLLDDPIRSADQVRSWVQTRARTLFCTCVLVPKEVC